MKILFIDLGCQGGAKVSLNTLISSLSSDIDYQCCLFRTCEKPQHTEDEAGVTYVPIRALGNSTLDPARWNIHWIVNFIKFFLYFPWHFMRIAYLIKKYNPTIVHINNLQSITPAIAAKLMGYAVVWHNRDCLADNWLSKIYRCIIYLCSDHVIAVSNAAAESLKGCAKSLTVMYNSVSINPVDANAMDYFRTYHRLNADDFCVLLLGNFSIPKGYIFASEIANKTKDYPTIHYLLAGKCDDPVPHSRNKWIWFILERCIGYHADVARIKEAWEKCDCEQYRFLGVVDADVAIAASDVVICPNIKTEGMGRTICEAAGHGKPVLASDMPSFEELITNGINGYLLKRDVLSWTSAIIDLYKNSNKCRSLGERGLAKFEQYDPDAYAKKIKIIYNDICIKKNKGHSAICRI
ncbi:MAG: glycosyltransferase [Bacteroidia bacterium]|nr:glycosyltransferase [Bacteroidia bacterium]